MEKKNKIGISKNYVKHLFYDDCWSYHRTFDIYGRVIDDNAYKYLWTPRKGIGYEIDISECKCEDCPYKDECNNLGELYNKKKKTEDKIKAEIKSILPTCKTHNEFIENVCKILDKYFDASYDTIMDRMVDYSDQNHIEIWFLKTGGTMLRIDTTISRKTIENGASFDDLNIWYNPSHLKDKRGDDDDEKEK